MNPVIHTPRPFFHMLEEDRTVFARWLSLFEPLFDRYEYDVHVGPVPNPLHPLPPHLQELMDTIYSLRIDVVAWKGEQPTIIEVKPSAGLSAIGQLYAYRFFWIEQKKSEKEPLLMVVTANARPYMKPLFESAGIEYWVI